MLIMIARCVRKLNSVRTAYAKFYALSLLTKSLFDPNLYKPFKCFDCRSIKNAAVRHANNHILG